MIDSILEVGSSFDWISPLAGFVGDLLNGPSHTFLIPYDASPLSGREIAHMLSRRGVKSWGRMIVSGTFMISVCLDKARWAQHLLEQAGVPIENPVPVAGRGRSGRRRGAKAPAVRGRGARARKSEGSSIADAVSDILDTPLF